jgi:predicted HD superfamily hydrolase involved in NAD metabolism
MDTEQLINYFSTEIQKEITESRFAHSLRVAELAEIFSLYHGYTDGRRSYLAGVLHDITKQKSKDFHTEIFIRNNFDYSILPETAYHAFSAVFYLQEKYNYTDKEILSAVQNHTLGGINTSLLDRILYISDFLGSDFAARQSEYQDWIAQTKENLYNGLFIKSKVILQGLIEKKAPIHPFTLETYNLSVSLSPKVLLAYKKS